MLSDFNTLGFEGLQVLATVGELPDPPPVVIVTGTGSEEIAVEAMKRGAADYVIKTASHLRRLPVTIHAALDKRRLEGERASAHLALVIAYDATIEGWSRALDLRDRETEGHTLRVTRMTLEPARRMSIPEEEREHLRRGALLHDIGKLGVPDQILHKPEALTPEEWAIMRRHPQYALELLEPIAFLRPALDIPFCHHERWDGSGYPRGLRGEQIPLVARLFAVVDVWDALRSDRPHRRAWSREKALAHLREISGTLLDPAAVRAFLELLASRDGA